MFQPVRALADPLHLVLQTPGDVGAAGQLTIVIVGVRVFRAGQPARRSAPSASSKASTSAPATTLGRPTWERKVTLRAILDWIERTPGFAVSPGTGCARSPGAALTCGTMAGAGAVSWVV